METGGPSGMQRKSRKRIAINWWWLLGLSLAVGIIVGIAGWRYIGQKGDVAQFYLETADQAYQDEDWQAASDAYYQYFNFRQ